ncbi:MAG TPA: glycosyltransferase [Firmicutes bacterium]|nr:glycosyltransferase [Bacillota bacterium]
MARQNRGQNPNQGRGESQDQSGNQGQGRAQVRNQGQDQGRGRHHGRNHNGSWGPVVSVIVPTYNRKAILEKCLRALLDQTFPADRYEIVVIDDGSTDGTRDMVDYLVRQWHGRAPEASAVGGEVHEAVGPARCPLVYRYRAHTSAAAARNEGIRIARGVLLIFLDSDIVTRADFLKAHVMAHVSEALRKRKGWRSEEGPGARGMPGVLSLQGVTWTRAGHDGDDLAAILDSSKVIVHGRVIYTTNLENPTAEPRKISDISMAFFASGNVSIARRWLIEAGLFDEDFTEYGWEDLELGKRLKKLGLRVVRSEAPGGYHLKHEFRVENLPAIRRREIERGHMAVVYLRKHPTFSVRMTTMIIPPFFWLVSVLAAGGWPDRPGAARLLDRLQRGGHRTLVAVALQIMVYYWYAQGVKEALGRPSGSPDGS